MAAEYKPTTAECRMVGEYVQGWNPDGVDTSKSAAVIGRRVFKDDPTRFSYFLTWARRHRREAYADAQLAALRDKAASVSVQRAQLHKAMRDAWAAGVSLRQIAEATQVSHTTVRNIVQQG